MCVTGVPDSKMSVPFTPRATEVLPQCIQSSQTIYVTPAKKSNSRNGSIYNTGGIYVKYLQQQNKVLKKAFLFIRLQYNNKDTLYLQYTVRISRNTTVHIT